MDPNFGFTEDAKNVTFINITHSSNQGQKFYVFELTARGGIVIYISRIFYTFEIFEFLWALKNNENFKSPKVTQRTH